MASYPDKALQWIDQSIINEIKKTSKCILGKETLCNNANNLFEIRIHLRVGIHFETSIFLNGELGSKLY